MINIMHWERDLASLGVDLGWPQTFSSVLYYYVARPLWTGKQGHVPSIYLDME